MGIILAIIIFGLIILIHELGHFSLAKKNGITVEEFSLGMGPTLLSKEYKGTKYCLKLLPLGGSCMMGEDDTEDQTPGSFNSKSVWARISVIAAGPIFNFILAMILGVILVGFVGYDEPVITQTQTGMPAAKAGIQAGDKIVKVNGSSIHLWREFLLYNQTHQGETTEITYKRAGKETSVSVTPKKDESGYYLFGITGPGAYTKANVFTAVQYGTYEVGYMIQSTLDGLKMLITRKIGMNQLAGPVGVVNIVDQTYESAQSSGAGVGGTILSLMNIAILLTANLGVMNLIPFPALDGGRLFFLLIEAVRGKRVPPEKEGMVHFAGFVLLMGLMVFVLYNDIIRIIG